MHRGRSLAIRLSSLSWYPGRRNTQWKEYSALNSPHLKLSISSNDLHHTSKSGKHWKINNKTGVSTLNNQRFLMISQERKMATDNYDGPKDRNKPRFPSLNFTNSVLKALPIEKETGNFNRQVPDALFSRVTPTPVENPHMVVLSPPALELIDVKESHVDNQDAMDYFSGNKGVPGSFTTAHCYCGFQYGAFSGQLGDGAVIYLGGITNQLGQEWEVQLKGAGRTPYSRVNTDGRKVLRSSIREVLCSEAMHHLGVPTTRAGFLLASDTKVSRDIEYTGQTTQEKAAVLLRLAPSFIRIGSFEVCKTKDPLTGVAGPSAGNTALLQQLCDYVISTFYPEIQNKYESDPDAKIVAFFEELSRHTARLVAQWQSLGFCHGVLNTDNISIIGLSMDYGPFQFMDAYDPDHLSNASDHWARHTYSRQPEVSQWCLERLREVLQQAVSSTALQDLDLNTVFHQEFNTHYMNIMRQKLGLKFVSDEDEQLVSELLDTMQHTGADFSKVFRSLSRLHLPGTAHFKEGLEELQTYLLENCCCSAATLRHIYRKRTCADPQAILRSLWVLQMHPNLLPSYHQTALEAVDRLNNREIRPIVKSMSQKEKTVHDAELWSKWLDRYSTRLQLEVPEVNHKNDLEKASYQRSQAMDKVNPRFVLKNHILQTSISQAESGNYTGVRALAKMVADPYSSNPGLNSAVDVQEQEAMALFLSEYDQGPREQDVKRTVT